MSNEFDFDELKKVGEEVRKAVTEDIIPDVAGSLKEALEGIKEGFSEQNTSGGYHKPHSTPGESQAFAQELQEKRRAREEEKRKQQEKQQQINNEQTAIQSRDTLSPALFNPVGNGLSTGLVVGGSVGVGVFGIVSLVSTVSELIKSLAPAYTASFGGPVFFIILTFVSLGMLIFGSGKKSFINKARRYAQVCGTHMYADIKDIAASMGLKASKVRKDLRRMLQKGFFPHGYFDDSESTLMLTDEVYKEYLASKHAIIDTTCKEIDESELYPEMDPETRAEFINMVNEGEDCINRLHKLNDDIPGEEISQKLDVLENLLREIFSSLRKHTEQMNRMQKTMDYYLPTMLKMVEAYKEYDSISNPGEQILNAMKEIEQTLDTINEAFVQLQNNLFRDSVWDVTSDAKVLKTMLKQEGLASDMKEPEKIGD